MTLLSRNSVEPLVRQVSISKDKVNVDFTVVVAVDGSEVSQKVVDAAIKIYRPGMYFHLVNVVLNPSTGNLKPHQNLIATGGDPNVLAVQQLDEAALELAKLDSLYSDKLTAAHIPYTIDEVPVLPNLLQVLGFHQGAGIGATICKYAEENGADMVLVGKLHAGVLGNAILQHVVYNLDRPVLVV